MTRRTRRPTATRTALRVVAVTAAVLLGAAGCATPPPVAEPEPAPAVAPAVMSPEQNDAVLADLGTVLATADTAMDPSLLAARVSGPALTMRTAEYLHASAPGGGRAPTALPTAAQAEIVPQTTTWPRAQLVVTEQPDDLQAPRILVLQQATARDQYALWGWARLFPGVSMPKTAEATTGSPVLDPSTDALLVRPDEVLAAYAVALTGTDDPTAVAFGDDPFRTGVVAARQALAAGVQEIGTAAETYTPDPDGPLTVLGTVDGGAIVVGRMTTVSTVTITLAGAKLTLSAYETALSGVAEATSSLARTYTDVLVFYVPPAGANTAVQLLGAEAVLTAVGAQ